MLHQESFYMGDTQVPDCNYQYFICILSHYFESFLVGKKTPTSFGKQCVFQCKDSKHSCWGSSLRQFIPGAKVLGVTFSAYSRNNNNLHQSLFKIKILPAICAQTALPNPFILHLYYTFINIIVTITIYDLLLWLCYSFSVTI